MAEAVILGDVVVEVMVVTKAEVMGDLEPLHHNMVGATDRAEASDAVITGNLLVCDCMASVLFEPASTFSYVSSSFSNGLNLHC